MILDDTYDGIIGNIDFGNGTYILHLPGSHGSLPKVFESNINTFIIIN